MFSLLCDWYFMCWIRMSLFAIKSWPSCMRDRVINLFFPTQPYLERSRSCSRSRDFPLNGLYVPGEKWTSLPGSGSRVRRQVVNKSIQYIEAKFRWHKTVPLFPFLPFSYLSSSRRLERTVVGFSVFRGTEFSSVSVGWVRNETIRFREEDSCLSVWREVGVWLSSFLTWTFPSS